MNQKKISRGSLLFHAVHGLCCVKDLIESKENGAKKFSYSLEPRTTNKAKVRFVIPADDIEASGFHSLVSPSQANSILQYLKSGNSSQKMALVGHEAARMAQDILSFLQENKDAKDQKSRLKMERSVSGLVGELSAVFKTDFKKAAALVRASLGAPSKINPLVLNALANTSEN